MAMKAVTQLTLMATTYELVSNPFSQRHSDDLLNLGDADSGYIYEAYILDVFETALIAARAAARCNMTH